MKTVQVSDEVWQHLTIKKGELMLEDLNSVIEKMIKEAKNRKNN